MPRRVESHKRVSVSSNSPQTEAAQAPGGRFAWLRALLAPAGKSRFGLIMCAAAALLVLRFTLPRSAFDFDCYWVGAWAVRDGQAARMYAALDAPDPSGRYDLSGDTPEWRALAAKHLAKPHDLWGFIYPPPCAVLFVPLTWLPHYAALLLWRCMNLAGYLLGGLMLLYLFRARLRPPEGQILAFLALASPPFLLGLGIGQITPLVFLTLAAGLFYLETDRPVAAGLWLAAGTLLKVSPGLFAIWLLIRRQGRALAAWAAGLLVFSALAVPITGLAPFERFIGHVLPLLARGTMSDTNVSAVAAAGRLLIPGDPHSAQILPPDARLTLFKLGFLAVVLTVSAVCLLRGRRRDTPERVRLEFALVNATALLLSPITWGHHLLLAGATLLPVAVWCLRQGRAGMLALAGGAWLLMLQNGDLPGSLLPVPVGAVAALIGLLLLWSLACVALVRSA
jgi:hypothetical protein